MDNEKRPARQLAEMCGTMDVQQIAAFLAGQGFRSYPELETLTPENRQALEDLRDEFFRERDNVTGAQLKDDDRRASETVHSMILRRLRSWDLAATARALADIYHALDREGVVAFLREHGFPGEPETWTEEQAEAVQEIVQKWILLVCNASPAVRNRGKRGYFVVLEVLEGFLDRWNVTQPMRVEVEVTDFYEERTGEIFRELDSWKKYDNGHRTMDDTLVLYAELPNTERSNEEGIARRIAQDIFRANGATCTVSVKFLQGLDEEARTYDFGSEAVCLSVHPGSSYHPSSDGDSKSWES